MNEQNDQVAPPVSKVQYRTDAEGRTFRTPPGGESQHVSTIGPDDVVEYVSLETKKYAPAVLSHLKKFLAPQGRSVQGTRVAGEPAGAMQEAPQTQTVTIQPSAAPAPVVTAPAPNPAIPPAPMLDKMLGDKTPEYVQWLQTYHPEEFRRRYGVMEGGREVEFTTKEKQVGPNGKVVDVEVRRRGLLAARKTIVTHAIGDRSVRG